MGGACACACAQPWTLRRECRRHRAGRSAGIIGDSGIPVGTTYFDKMEEDESCRQGEKSWKMWRAGAYGSVSLSDGVIEYAMTYEEIKKAFYTFQKNADQIYQSWKEQLGYKGESLLWALVAFVAPGAPASPRAGAELGLVSLIALSARGGAQYDISDADIVVFYKGTFTGSCGDQGQGTSIAEMIVKYFYGEFTPQGFKRYSGMWKGPSPGAIDKRGTTVAMGIFTEQLKKPAVVVKGGVGPSVDEMQKVVHDGKGRVWLAADMTPGGLAIGTCTPVPFSKRPLFLATQGAVGEMLSKANWSLMDKRIDFTGGSSMQAASFDWKKMAAFAAFASASLAASPKGSAVTRAALDQSSRYAE